MASAVKDIDPKVLVKHSEMMQTKKAYEDVTRSVERMGITDPEELKQDVIRAHNISERLLRIMAEEHAMEKFNDRVLAIVLYNVVFGGLSSTTSTASLLRVTHFWESIEASIPRMVIEKLLASVIRDI